MPSCLRLDSLRSGPGDKDPSAGSFVGGAGSPGRGVGKCDPEEKAAVEAGLLMRLTQRQLEADATLWKLQETACCVPGPQDHLWVQLGVLTGQHSVAFLAVTYYSRNIGHHQQREKVSSLESQYP